MKLIESIHFHGPFAFRAPGNTIANSEFAKSEGIYLWTLSDSDSIYIHYIGETTSFLKRQKEHLLNILSLNYGLFSPNAVAENSPTPIYGGAWRDKSSDPLTGAIENWDIYKDQIIPYIDSLHVYFAETACDTSARRHIEACIAHDLRVNHPEDKLFYPDDNRTTMRKVKLGYHLRVHCSDNIKGLSDSIEI